MALRTLIIALCWTRQVLCLLPPPFLAPSNYPLQFITPELAASSLVESLKNTLLPGNFNDIIAIATAEGSAGALAGVATAIIGSVDGNKSNKSAISQITASSGFFFLSGIFKLVGGSTLLINLLAIVLITEVLKARTKDVQKKQVKVEEKYTLLELMRFRDTVEKPSSFKMNQIMRFKEVEKPSSSKMDKMMRLKDSEAKGKKSPVVNRDSQKAGASKSASKIPLISTEQATLLPLIRAIEGIDVTSDIVKWAIFGLLCPDDASLLTVFIAGSLAGLAGQVTTETKKRKRPTVYTYDSPLRDFLVLRIGRSMIEGAVQFWSFTVIRTLLMGQAVDLRLMATQLLPDGLGADFVDLLTAASS